MRDPIDNPENNMAERVITDAIHWSRSILADAMSPLLWEAAEDAYHEINIPSGWEDWYLDNKEHIIEQVYDELYADARTLWEG